MLADIWCIQGKLDIALQRIKLANSLLKLPVNTYLTRDSSSSYRCGVLKRIQLLIREYNKAFQNAQPHEIEPVATNICSYNQAKNSNRLFSRDKMGEFENTREPALPHSTQQHTDIPGKRKAPADPNEKKEPANKRPRL